MDGNAPEFLWGIEKNPNPLIEGQDRSYVAMTIAGLVKATMSDANGFVEGMEEPVLMAFLRLHPWILQNIFGVDPNTLIAEVMAKRAAVAAGGDPSNGISPRAPTGSVQDTSVAGGSPSHDS